MRDTSSNSSISFTSCDSCRSIIANTRAESALTLGRRRNTCSPVRIGASGLRSSWASVARNSSLRWSARRSASSASRWRTNWSRIWYCQRRPRSAACTALTIERIDDGRSSTVTLRSRSSARRTSADCSRPRHISTVGMSDHGGWRSSTSCSTEMSGSISTSSVSINAPTPPSTARASAVTLSQGVQPRPAPASARRVTSVSRRVGASNSTRSS
jgi:hypothetical protein